MTNDAVTDPILALHGITKSFPGVLALHEVAFSLRSGEIHALMGENGAGKSTLIKVLTGIYPRDAGRITLGGRDISPGSPHDAEKLGISTVYQEVNLIPDLSVAENICLGRQPRRLGLLDWPGIRRRAESALARLHLTGINVTRPVRSCSLAVQQMVAFARALDVSARVLILDEPTSSLDENEVSELFRIMRQLKQDGLGIVFVTHFLDQVYAVSDRITVLRNGRYVNTFNTAELPRIGLIGQMLGRSPEEISETFQPRRADEPRRNEVFLRATRLGRRGVIEDVNLCMRKGEILGLAGLLGSGRTETARLLFGADRATGGALAVNGQDVTVKQPCHAIALGMAFCSEDRNAEGLLPSLSVRDNIILALQASRGALRLLPRAEQASIAARYIESLRIRTPSAETPICQLSGGNQQKVLLARWLALSPSLLILDEPTRGIDVGAKAEIEKLIARLRDDGLSVLLISSELEEVARACDRVVVLRDRRLIGELTGAEIEPDRVMHMIAGQETA